MFAFIIIFFECPDQNIAELSQVKKKNPKHKSYFLI